jgi:hypothetical protein
MRNMPPMLLAGALLIHLFFSVCGTAETGKTGITLVAEQKLLIDEGTRLAEDWLKHRNQIEGIELVGGPFLLGSYTHEIRGFTNPPFVELRFRSTNGFSVPGKVGSFQVFGSRVDQPPTNAFPVHFGLSSWTNLKRSDVEAIEQQIAGHSFFQETNDIVEIDIAGVPRRKRGFFLPVKSLEVNGRELVVHTGGGTFSELRRRRFRMEHDGTNWVVSAEGAAYMGSERFRGRAAGQSLTLVVKGELSNSEIANIARHLEEKFGRLPASVYLDRTDNGVYVDPDLQDAEPTIKFIFHRENDRWIPRHRLQISYLSLPTGLVGQSVLPFLPKPTPTEADAALADASLVARSLTRAERRFFAETTLRVRGIDHRLLEIRRPRKDEVRVRTGIGSGAIITFKRLGGRWIITSIGNWIS